MIAMKMIHMLSIFTTQNQCHPSRVDACHYHHHPHTHHAMTILCCCLWVYLISLHGTTTKVRYHFISEKILYSLIETQHKSRVAPWCGKGKNWKDVWLTGDLRVFDYVLLTDINIPFGISSCKHRFRNNLNISLCVW